MKNRKIMEAYDQTLPSDDKLEKVLEEIINMAKLLGYDRDDVHSESMEIGLSEEDKYHRVRAKKVIPAAAVAIIVALGIIFGTESEALAGIRKWFSHPREDDPKTVIYEFTEDYTDKKLPQIVIGWLPEDFEGVEPQIGKINDNYTFSRLYIVNEQRMVDFTISYMHNGGKIYISSEEGETLQSEDMVINGNVAHIYYDSVSSVLLMHDDENGIEIDISSNIEIEEIIKIAENLQFAFD